MGWLEGLGDGVNALLLAYGYPALALILFTGAVGFPLPSGAATSVVGSLAADGELSWVIAAAVATIATVAGDLVGYQIGSAVGCPFLDRHGRWLGLSHDRLLRTVNFFGHWGGIGLLLSRTVLSALSPAVSLLAGAGHYPRTSFILYDVVGRLAWTAIYLGIGFGFDVGGDLASSVPLGLWGALLVLALAGVAGGLLYRRRAGHVDGGR